MKLSRRLKKVSKRTIVEGSVVVGLVTTLLLTFVAMTKSMKVAGCVQATMQRLINQYGEPPADIRDDITEKVRHICEKELSQ